MSQSKRKVVRGISYPQEGEKRRGVIIPADVPEDQHAAYYKRHLLAEVRELTELIRLDRESVLEELHERQEEQLLAEELVVFPDIFAIVGREMFKQWRLEGVELEHCWLMKGQCGSVAHTWFRFEMSAEEVGEPQWFYVVDPYMRGCDLIHMGCPSPPESDFCVVRPWSPFHLLYGGERVDRLWSGEEKKEEKGSGAGRREGEH